MIRLKIMNMHYVLITNYVRKTRLQVIEKNIVQKNRIYTNILIILCSI